MSRQQLYISGKAVDMPSEEIKLKVASNIFSDADKVMTAHSYNVSLPRTMTNDSILAMAYIVGADTGGKSTHRYLSASLYVDGVPLFEGGSAVLTSVDDKGYNLTLLWGIIGVFDEIKREGLKVNELPLSIHWHESNSQWFTLQQNNHPIADSYNSGMDATIYDTLDADSKATADKYPWWMPANSAVNILNKIAGTYGITFTFSATAQQRLDKLMHIATTLRTMVKGELVTWGTINVMRSVGSNKYNIEWYDNNGSTASSLPIYQNALVFDNDHACKARLATHFKSIRVYGWRDRNDYHIVFADAPDNVVQIDPTYNSENGRWEVDKTWYDAQLDEGHFLPFITGLPEGVPLGNTDLRIEVVIDEVADTHVGLNWEYTRNAPDVKIIDYIGECLAHIGGFIVGSVTSVATVRILTFDEVAQATPTQAEMLGLKSITMSLDDLAQRNVYSHAENKDDEAEGMSPYLAEGVIYTNDATLELERSAYKSSFKVPRTNKVLHWDVEKNEGANSYKATWKNAGENILGTDITFKFFNSGQDFARTIAAYYGEYEKVVRRPKAVEVIVRMQVLDFMAVDFTHPVYIEQLGSSFLVVSIESDKGDSYKIKMVKL